MLPMCNRLRAVPCPPASKCLLLHEMAFGGHLAPAMFVCHGSDDACDGFPLLPGIATTPPAAAAAAHAAHAVF